MKDECLTAEFDEAGGDPMASVAIPCEFCSSHAVTGVEKVVHGVIRFIWLCDKCAGNTNRLKNWEVLEND